MSVLECVHTVGSVKESMLDFICGKRQLALVKLSKNVFINKRFLFSTIQSMIIEELQHVVRKWYILKMKKWLKLNVVELFNKKM